MDNDATRAILVVKANSASTDIDANETKTCDQYRQLFRARFDKPVVEMKENKDFKEDQVTRAIRRREDAQAEPPPQQRSFRHRRHKLLGSLRNLVPYWRRSVESFSTDSRAALGTDAPEIPGSSHWQGLSRYLDDQQNDKARWSSVEYAADSTVLDLPEATLTIYWDVVGRVAE